jgi:transcriptional regulator with XRE-family HTH domain
MQIMMENNNTEWIAMSDKTIVAQIGTFIKEQRLQHNKTQAQIAEEAGVNRSTLSQIENGEAISMLSLIQIMRILGILHLFETFKVVHEVSPLELAKMDQQKRQRASTKNNDDTSKSDW